MTMYAAIRKQPQQMQTAGAFKRRLTSRQQRRILRKIAVSNSLINRCQVLIDHAPGANIQMTNL